MIGKLRSRIVTLNSWILIGICFALPVQAAPVYILSALLLMFWIVQPNLPERIGELVQTRFVWAAVSYYGVFLLSMLWTEDKAWGWHMVGRQIPFLLFPLYWSVAKTKNVQRQCVTAFVISMTLSMLLAYYNWFHMHTFPSWPDGIKVNKAVGDTAPFVDRIMYAPMLAFAAYFMGYKALFDRSRAAWGYGFLFFLATLNIFFSGGRAGLVCFFALFVTLLVQRFAAHPFRAIMGACLMAMIALVGAYSTNAYFKQRMDSAIAEVSDPVGNINGAVGLRINFFVNTSRIIREHPWLGVGVGDYTAAYDEMNKKYTPQAISTVNPHNQFLLILSTTGLLGGIALMSLVWTTIGSSSYDFRPQIKHYLWALWIGYATMCMFESYLWRSNTALFFVVMMALFMSQLEVSKKKN